MNAQERAELAQDVAVRVVELLREDVKIASRDFDRPLTVAQVADALGLSPDWVRNNRHRLGVLPAEGKRPRLMFDPAKVREAMRAPIPELPAEPRRRARTARPRSGRREAELLRYPGGPA